MLFFAAALLGLAAFYAGTMARYALGFRRVRLLPPPPPTPGDLPLVSVLVPARNEATTIEACLRSILANDYPPDRLELIVLDDGSTDDTAARVRRMQPAPMMAFPEGRPDPAAATRPEVRLVSIEHAGRRAHKKAALTRGVEMARGEIVLTTDADCRVPSGWIRTMVRLFASDVAFVSGPVLFAPADTLFGRLQALEFLGLVAVGHGAIGAGRPNLCNGANVAYRRDVFLALGGYAGLDHLTSGDDELLMQRVAYETPWRVQACSDPAAAVRTPPAHSLPAFVEQRRRWASKGPRYPRPALVGLLSAIYLFYVLLLAGLCMLPFVPGSGAAVAAALSIKIVGEASLLVPACVRFGQLRLLPLFLPEQLLQIPYVVLIAPLGALGGYRWKGRRIDR